MTWVSGGVGVLHRDVIDVLPCIQFAQPTLRLWPKGRSAESRPRRAIRWTLPAHIGTSVAALPQRQDNRIRTLALTARSNLLLARIRATDTVLAQILGHMLCSIGGLDDRRKTIPVLGPCGDADRHGEANSLRVDFEAMHL